MQGTILGGKYEILGLVGKGGMGRVYEARHREVQRVVAVKVLRPELAADPTAVERFRREAVAAGRLDHDNICEVFDFGVHEGAPFYVMPLLRGRSLAEAIRQSGPMPPCRAVDIATQILAALAAAHEVGLVHRDLKPDNVFLTRVADRVDLVKVLDFGIAKIVRRQAAEGGSHDTLTDTGVVLGTPCYLSPEQARGERGVDSRTDLYAVGVILYEMLTGRRAFDGVSHNDVLWKIWNVPVPALRSVRPDLPEALQEVVHRAMSRDREDRYPNAEAMREALVEAASARSGAGDHFATQSTRPDGGAVPAGDEPEARAEGSPEEASGAPGAEGPVRAADGSSRRGLLAIAVGVGAAILAVGLIAGPRLVATGARPTRGGGPSDSPEPAPPGPVPLVTVTLEGVPEGASVLLDGVPVDGPALRSPPSPRWHELRVEHAGHRPWRRRIAFASSQTIPVELEPVETRPGAPSDAGPRPPPRPARRPLAFDTAFPDP